MKKMIILLSLFMAVGPIYSQGISTQKVTKKPILEIYYTHSTNRCAGCKAIEAETIETLNKQFKSQLDNGEIALHVVNIDEKENKQFVDEYEVWGSSLFMIKNGDKKSIVDLTREGFATARTKPEIFHATLAQKIKEILK